jgi:hypothetical protein
MKMSIFIAVLFSCLAIVNAQDTEQKVDQTPKAESFKKLLEKAQKPKDPSDGQINLNFDDGCGSAAAESQIYGYRYGKVIEITSDNKITVRVVR